MGDGHGAVANDPNDSVEAEVVEESYPEHALSIGIPAEVVDLEKRVAMVPRLVKSFRKLGYAV
jgi:hypothetical protein